MIDSASCFLALVPPSSGAPRRRSVAMTDNEVLEDASSRAPRSLSELARGRPARPSETCSPPSAS
jgi:hypothetical protein